MGCMGHKGAKGVQRLCGETSRLLSMRLNNTKKQVLLLICVEFIAESSNSFPYFM